MSMSQPSPNEIIEFAMETKKRMISRDTKRGHRKCPNCGGRVNFALAGKRNHLHMACQFRDCNMRMME